MEFGGIRYPKDCVNINYGTKDYLDQCKDIKLFHEELSKEPLLKPFLSNTDMRKFYPNKVNDLRVQVDHVIPKKNSTFQRIQRRSQ